MIHYRDIIVRVKTREFTREFRAESRNSYSLAWDKINCKNFSTMKVFWLQRTNASLQYLIRVVEDDARTSREAFLQFFRGEKSDWNGEEVVRHSSGSSRRCHRRDLRPWNIYEHETCFFFHQYSAFACRMYNAYNAVFNSYNIFARLLISFSFCYRMENCNENIYTTAFRVLYFVLAFVIV